MALSPGLRLAVFLWVRSCCFMLSLRVKALLQVGQTTDFSPVCFLPWRAAWPEVVKVSEQLKRVACGQGNFFFGRPDGAVGEELEFV